MTRCSPAHVLLSKTKTVKSDSVVVLMSAGPKLETCETGMKRRPHSLWVKKARSCTS